MFSTPPRVYKEIIVLKQFIKQLNLYHRWRKSEDPQIFLEIRRKLGFMSSTNRRKWDDPSDFLHLLHKKLEEISSKSFFLISSKIGVSEGNVSCVSK